jgi:hypothetical protein
VTGSFWNQRLSALALLFCGLLAVPLLAQNPAPATPQTAPATQPDQTTPAAAPNAPAPGAQEAPPPPSTQTLAQQAQQI